MSRSTELTATRRMQIVAVSFAGVIAGVSFLLSLTLDGTSADAFRIIATIAAGACALIGITFAFVGNDR